MIGGRIFDDTVLVGFASAGWCMCWRTASWLAGMRRAAEVRGWLRTATRRAEPLALTPFLHQARRHPADGGQPKPDVCL
jgi:hypothetical protein